MALLSVEDIHPYYGEAHILQGVSLRLEEGEVVTLIGRNGAGKTTILRSIMGIARPGRGRVVRDADFARLQTHEIARRGMAWIPEERRIRPNLTVQALEVAMRRSHRLYVMDQGRIQLEGTPDALRRDPTIQQRFLEV